MGDIGVYDSERKKWIQFDKDTEVLIKHVNKELLAEIRAKAKKAAKLSGIDVSDVMNLRFSKVAVLGWRKIGEPEHPGITVGGKPLAFTPENLAMLMTKSLKFSNFVNEQAVDEDEFLEGCEETKNDL